jgi:hypothetical protein
LLESRAVRASAMSRTALLRVTSVVVTILLAACGGGTRPGGGQPWGGRSTAVSPAARDHANRAAQSLDSGVVATVAGQEITLAQYQRAYRAQTQSIPSGGIPLDPPSYTRCAAAMARVYSRLKASRRARAPSSPSPAALVRQCRARGAGIRQGVMAQLIQQRWLADEARTEGVTVSDSTVNAAVARQQRALGGPVAYKRYLARTGQSEQQARDSVRLVVTEQLLQQRRLGAQASISEQQVTAYFDAHRAEFMLPHHRAPKRSMYEARIRLLLEQEALARSSASATAALERRWRAKTICARGYVVPLCANASA